MSTQAASFASPPLRTYRLFIAAFTASVLAVLVSPAITGEVPLSLVGKTRIIAVVTMFPLIVGAAMVIGLPAPRGDGGRQGQSKAVHRHSTLMTGARRDASSSVPWSVA